MGWAAHQFSLLRVEYLYEQVVAYAVVCQLMWAGAHQIISPPSQPSLHYSILLLYFLNKRFFDFVWKTLRIKVTDTQEPKRPFSRLTINFLFLHILPESMVWWPFI